MDRRRRQLHPHLRRRPGTAPSPSAPPTKTAASPSAPRP
jgi:hypothetical protein